MRTDGFYVESGTVTQIPDGGNFKMEVFNEADSLIDTVPIAVENNQWSIDLPQVRSGTWPDKSKFRLVAETPEGRVTTKFFEITDEDGNLSVIFQRIGTGGTSSQPVITSPAPNTTLTGTTVTVMWSDPNAPTSRRYDLWINGVDQGPSITETAWVVTGLPDDGSAIAVELRYTDDDWVTQNIVTVNYTAVSSGLSPPGLLDSTLTVSGDGWTQGTQGASPPDISSSTLTVTGDGWTQGSQGGTTFIPTSIPADDSRDNTEYGNWIGTAGVMAPPSGNTLFTKVEFRPQGGTAVSGGGNDGHFGADRRLDLAGDEAWMSFWIFIGTDLDQQADIKIPGFSSQITGGAAGGQGNLGGGGSLSWSARGVRKDPSGNPPGGGFTIYHKDSPIQPSADPEWWGNNTPNETGPKTEAAINAGQWHRVIQYVKLNDIGLSNGILRCWLDETNTTLPNAIYNRADFSFTDNASYHSIAIWFNLYHGGTSEVNALGTVFFDNFKYSLGPTNNVV